MRKTHLLFVGLWLCGSLALLCADTFQLTDGTSVEGEILLPAKADALQIKRGPNDYVRVSWDKLTQETLKRLAENKDVAQFVTAFIEVPEEERLKKTEVVIKPVPRLERPARSSLIGGLFGSSVGLFAIFLIYVANIYAAYEIALVRAYPPVMVCGLAAVAPFVGPIIFLFLPTRLPSATETTLVEAAEATRTHAAGVHQTAEASEAAFEHAHSHTPAGAASAHGSAASAAAASSTMSAPQVFRRGQFTFNRRFMETKFASFFGLARSEAEKAMLLVVKTPRGTYDATRITRIASNDMHVETAHGEIQIPFGEIQELILKHKGA